MGGNIKGVIKYGIGYDLIVEEHHHWLVLGIRCHICQRVSYNPKDVNERYCGACHKFHEDHIGSQQA